MIFETYLSVPASVLPDEYLRLLAVRYGDVYERDELVDDVMVEVQAHEGWYHPGNRAGHPDNWTPPEGEDPEIRSVVLLEEDYKGECILEKLPKDVFDTLLKECWHEQDNSQPY